MRKLIPFFILAAFVIACGNLSGQAVYTGAAQPKGYIVQKHIQSDNPNAILCQPCASPEGEPDIQDGGVDVTNGGCNFLPNVYSTISIGSTICGRCNGYVTDATDWRDTDWYRFTLTQTQTVYWSGIANFDCSLIIADNVCAPSVLGSAFPLAGNVGTVSLTLSPGTYIFFIASTVYGHNPGSTGNYMVTLTTQAPGVPTTWCNPVAPVPTLSQWGLILLAAVLLAAGTLYIIRRRSTDLTI